MNKNTIFCFSRYLLLLLATLFINACADDDNLDQPTELVPFYSEHYLDVAWHASTGEGVEEHEGCLQRWVGKGNTQGALVVLDAF